MFRAVACIVLVVALLFPSVVLCSQPAPTQVEHKLPTASTTVVGAQDHWWYQVVKVVMYWIGGECFVQVVKYWVWRGKDQPEEYVQDNPNWWEWEKNDGRYDDLGPPK